MVLLLLFSPLATLLLRSRPPLTLETPSPMATSKGLIRLLSLSYKSSQAGSIGLMLVLRLAGKLLPKPNLPTTLLVSVPGVFTNWLVIYIPPCPIPTTTPPCGKRDDYRCISFGVPPAAISPPSDLGFGKTRTHFAS